MSFVSPPDLSLMRQKKGISLEEIAGATRISVRHLRSIEASDFASLPGGIYNISYIRQYARAIDFSEDDLLEYYYQVTGILKEEAPAEPPRSKLSALARWARVLT